MSEIAQTDIVLLTSSAPQNWCLTRRGNQSWLCLTIARTDDKSVVGSIDTNDVKNVKESLSSSVKNIFIKTIHIVAPTSSGITTTEVLELSEAKLDGNVVFHRLETMFGVTKIDGQAALLPHQLEKCTFTSLYKSEFGTNRCKGLKPCRD